eukprot:TRINITY_DN1310_c0_g1_i1.p1 TRINITY_DN1310_c0_g1~~TRINITY_DN1310_c0_g1_i1.p1  ORF type:complete len:305 (-),score=78.71 TRINITY_DN1310_c0_g1_i1:55-915(-)
MTALLFLLSLALLVSCEPTFPIIPPAYMVDIEANLLETNQTFDMLQYYDATSQMMRNEINTLDGYTATIIDLKAKTQTVVENGEKCTGPTKLPESSYLNVRSVSQLLLLDQGFNYTYLGSEFVVRGVPCDSWITSISFTTNATTNGTQTRGPFFHQISFQYFFTVESWGFRAANATRKLVRVTMIGNRTHDSEIHQFNHNYEFINFVARTPPKTVFELPSDCLDIKNQVSRVLYSKSGAGVAAGMFFLGLFIGAGICGLSIWIYCRRRQQTSRRFNKQMVADEPEL